MARPPYRTAPVPTPGMPPGVPYIIGNEAAERFSFYGMRTILVIFMVKYLHLMGDVPGEPMSDAAANEKFHYFVTAVYFFPIFGALIADTFFTKYRTIIWLSLVYCAGHGLLALMGSVGNAEDLLFWGLALIAIGSGGIKPCVSAHVGDQFGKTNRNLLTKIFNWFYFSINLGAFISTLLTPWLLEWYGPHWAFGVPGVLMLIATIAFWMGRWKFIHVPARGGEFLREILSWEGIAALLKLCIIYVFVAVFWALFDQTGSSWVLQARDMDLNWMWIDWLPSQIQAINPILILCYIPLFTLVIYPAINKIFPLTPLRKISIGLFVMVLGFGIVALAQNWIDAGERPSIGWQIFAYALLTASEVMVSIVCLEFSYTQAPRALKSVIMALFLMSVSLGNFFTAGVNHFIQLPNSVALLDSTREEEGISARLVGLDLEPGTLDDISATYDEFGSRQTLEFAAKEVVGEAAEVIIAFARDNDGALPQTEAGNELLSDFKDPWGLPLVYTQQNSRTCRILSTGPDKTLLTKWDQGVILSVDPPPKVSEGNILSFMTPERPWLETRKKELGISDQPGDNGADSNETLSVSRRHFVGGQTKLEGLRLFLVFHHGHAGNRDLFRLRRALLQAPRIFPRGSRSGRRASYRSARRRLI